MFYEQHNLMKKHMTSGFGVSYKYEVKDQGIIFGKAGYFIDTYLFNYVSIFTLFMPIIGFMISLYKVYKSENR